MTETYDNAIDWPFPIEEDLSSEYRALSYDERMKVIAILAIINLEQLNE